MRAAELSFLLELSAGLVAAPDRPALLRTLHDLTQPEFGFHSLNLFVRTPDGQQLLDWATEQPGGLGPLVAALAYPAAGFAGLFDHLAQADGPAVLPYDALYFRLLGNATLRADTRRIVRAGGYRECLCALLHSGGQVVGYLGFNALLKGAFQPAQLEVFRALAEQAAAAVGGLLGREAAAAREREKTTLLEITELIAQVKAPSDLLRLIVENIKPLFSFYDCGLFVVSADGQTHKDITVALPEISPSEWATALVTTVSASLPHPGSPVEWAMAELAAAGQPVLFDFQDLAARFPDYPQFEGGEVLALGYRDCLAANLTVRGQAIGFFCLNARQKDFFQPATFPLFQAIAHSVAIAVANILANEEITEREQEKALLLSLSEDMTTIRDRDDLFRTLSERLRPVLGFDAAAITIYSDDLTQYRHLLVNPSPGLEAHPLYAQIVGGFLPIANSPDEYILARFGEDDLYHWHTTDMGPRYPTHPIVPLLSETGLLHNVHTALRFQGRLIGFFHVHYGEAGAVPVAKFPLLRAIAGQMAVAVANILANEDILARKQEKSVLLSISTAIATINDKRQLLQLLVEQVRPLFGFDDVGLGILDKDGQYIDDWAVQYADVLPADIAAKQSAAYRVPYPGSLLEHAAQEVMAAGQPLIYDLSPELGEEWPEAQDFLHAELADQQKEVLITTLRVGGQQLGLLNINSRQKGHFARTNHSVFQAVADQVAVAVANILANEEIVAREREKTLHLAVTTALTSADNWTAKLAAVAREIGRVAAWDNCQFTFPDRGSLDAGWRQRPDGIVERLSADTARRELDLTPLDWQALNRQTAPLQQRAAAYDEADVAGLAADYDLVRLMHEQWGVRALLYLPVWQNNELLAVLRLANTRPDAYPPAQLALLQRLAPQLALGLENLFSFEKIEQQERERTQQLALNNALVTIKDSFSLYQAVARELDPLVRLDSLSAWTFTADNLLHFKVLRKDEGGAFQDITEAARAAYAEMDTQETEALLRRELPPAVYTGDDFAAMCAQHLVYRVRRDQFGVASTLELPLPVRNGLRSLLVLGSRVAFAFTPDDLRQVLPFAPQIALAVENMVAHEELNQLRKQAEQEKVYLAEEIKTTHNFEEMVGVSPALHNVFRQIGQVAGTEATVLITGETGTGKELIARTLHAQSARRARTLIKLNCAALPASLIESELFGHEKGAFTGAVDRRVGKFELAQGSTIFLDEIGELPLELQSKLLRVLQEREFERLGGNKVLRADVRVVAATNRDLTQEVAAGRFRADLYYRLSVFPIHMPALRERPEDIPLLAQHFARKFARAMGKPYIGIREAALDELLTYNWPGNIRELENLVEQAVIVCPGPLEWSRPLRPLAPSAVATDLGLAAAATLKEELEFVERERILAALSESRGRVRGKKGAALLLGLKPTTLESRMEKLGIRKEQVIVSK